MLQLQVEQHNREIQRSFAERMDEAFGSMQHCLQQHGTRHKDMLSSYSQAIGKLCVHNRRHGVLESPVALAVK